MCHEDNTPSDPKVEESTSNEPKNEKSILNYRNHKIMVNPGKSSSVDELDNYIQQQIIITNEQKQCGICFQSSKNSSHLKEHIENHLEGLAFQCIYCNNSNASRTSLRWHITKRCGKK